MHTNVYRVAGTPITWRQSLLAASLGLNAVVSHRSAAALWRLVGFKHGIVELIMPRNRQRHDGRLVLHRARLSPTEITTIERIPVTTPARTLLDVAAIASPNAVEEALDDALRRKLVSVPRLRTYLDAQPRGRAGVRVLRAFVEARAQGGGAPDSPLETKIWRILVAAGITDGVRQHRIVDRGLTVAIPDVVFLDEMVAVEADSFEWHGSRSRWLRDLRRRNALLALGWRVLHFTWDDLARPDVVVATVLAALGRS